MMTPQNHDTPNMSVDIGGLLLKNPVMTASGTFGYGEEYACYVDINRLGAVVVKGVSLNPRQGNPAPRIMETPFGMINSIGLQNPGVKAFVTDKLPFLKQFDVVVIVNIFGETVDEYMRVADTLTQADGIHALEVNISCPNVEKGGMCFGTDPEIARDVTQRVKSVTHLPVIVKLSPNVTDIGEIAESVQAGGADAISLINTISGMSVDIENRRPHLQRVTGGLSGPAIKPVALKMVRDVVKRVSVPVIGVGGIMNASDALEFLIVGAKAVQVGTANFINPRATMDIIDGIEEYMMRHQMQDIRELIGTLNEGEGLC
ncbi:MAG: dihydroorotate dehydrogenase [Deltaproteobacteria bacterium]|nr:dihydroorotate dehydrogenase [Deltaproteobacteria bacterium]